MRDDLAGGLDRALAGDFERLTLPAIKVEFGEESALAINDIAIKRRAGDRVAQLIRSQMAGIVGNVALCAPLVLAAQWLAWQLAGASLVGAHEAEHVLDTLTLLGPTALFAAFTGVLLFSSSIIAGWVENWFVLNRLDSALRFNPRVTSRLGPARAARWAAFARANVSGFAANISLGFMLGLVPAITGFSAPPVPRSVGRCCACLSCGGRWPPSR